MASIKPTTKPSIHKITQAEVRAEVEKRNKVIEGLNAPPKPVRIYFIENIHFCFVEKFNFFFFLLQESRVVINDQLEENLNRMMADVNVASNVDEAIAVLKYIFFFQ